MPKKSIRGQSYEQKKDGLLVLGIDTGPDTHAYALLRFDHAHAIEFVSCGMGDTEAVAALDMPYTLVALERPAGGAYKPAIVAALLRTAYAAGIVEGLLRAKGAQIVPLCAADWRRDVCGQGSASDPIVKDSITRLIRGWPKRSNAHQRDAAGVALAAGWIQLREHQGGIMGMMRKTEKKGNGKARKLSTGGLP